MPIEIIQARLAYLLKGRPFKVEESTDGNKVYSVLIEHENGVNAIDFPLDLIQDDKELTKSINTAVCCLDDAVYPLRFERMLQGMTTYGKWVKAQETSRLVPVTGAS